MKEEEKKVNYTKVYRIQILSKLPPRDVAQEMRQKYGVEKPKYHTCELEHLSFETEQDAWNWISKNPTQNSNRLYNIVSINKVVPKCFKKKKKKPETIMFSAVKAVLKRREVNYLTRNKIKNGE